MRCGVMIRIRLVIACMIISTLALPAMGEDYLQSHQLLLSAKAALSAISSKNPSAELGYLTGIDFSQISITPSFKMGYEHNDLYLRLPPAYEMSVEGKNNFTGDSSELKIQYVRLWKGDVGFGLQFSPSMPLPYSSGRVSLIGGFRFDHYDSSFREPPILGETNGETFKNLLLSANYIRSEIKIPYFGLGVKTSHLAASLVGSPFVDADVTIGSSWNMDVESSYKLSGFSKLSLKNPGEFLGANLEYEIALPWRGRIELWGKGSWLRSNGPGTVVGSHSTNHPNLKVQLIQRQGMGFSSHDWAAGIRFSIPF
jgi:hypothetical protein